ncbi:hypothetical protein Anas_06218 [Armadillidium nasatum]|uniref:CRAL/TRIO N-terminal domain-containing protein n=1 Tax=Armadillidium nasatum TaxID=96803 RepID=A0A5N5SUR7_9CRUS|nr:hypothetical protein Anas_06218 [Armadillidium nasatum]
MNTFECLSEEDQEKVLKGLNEDLETKEKDIEHIKNWICQQPHFILNLSDFQILRFLRGSKYDLEKTKQKIDSYYSLKSKLPQWFNDRDPETPRLRELIKLGDVLQNFDIMCSLTGIGVLIDMKGLTMKHIMQYTPGNLSNVLNVWQNGYTAENKYWYVFHINNKFQIIYDIGKVFLKKDLRNRVSGGLLIDPRKHQSWVFFSIAFEDVFDCISEIVKFSMYIGDQIKLFDSNFEKMECEIPKRILPNEYGGEGGTFSQLAENCLEYIDSKRDWILEEEKNFIEESKRPK